MGATKMKVSEPFGFTYDFSTDGAQATYILPVFIPSGVVIPGIKILTGVDLTAGVGSLISFGIVGYAADFLMAATLTTLFLRDGEMPVTKNASIFTRGQMTMTVTVADITAGIIYVAVPTTKYVF